MKRSALSGHQAVFFLASSTDMFLPEKLDDFYMWVMSS